MNRNYWIVLGALGLGLLALLFGGHHFLVEPLRAATEAAVAQKKDIEQQLATARATAAQFVKFKAQAEQMRRNLEFYQSRTRQPLDPVRLSLRFQALANVVGLDAFQVRVDAPKAGPAGGLGQDHVSIHFNADFKRLGRFLNDCVAQRRIVIPTHLVVNGYTDPSGLYQDTVTVALDLTVYGAVGAGGR